MDSAQCKLKAAFTHMYPCARVPSNASSEALGHPDRNPELWRPWVFSAGDRQKRLLAKKTETNYGNTGSRGAHGFQHPVRLYMPKSKTDEYTQHMGKKVLANFPVQATIHFYNDDSDSEDDDEYEMELNVNYENVDCEPQNTFRNTMEDSSVWSTSLSVGLDQDHS